MKTSEIVYKDLKTAALTIETHLNGADNTDLRAAQAGILRSIRAMEALDAMDSPTITCPKCMAELDHWETNAVGGVVKYRCSFDLEGAIYHEEVGHNGDWEEYHYCPQCGNDITDDVYAVTENED